MRVNPYTALCTAIRNICNRTLQGHPCCQCLDFIQIDILMKPDSALKWSTDVGMLHPPALEHVNAAVIHFHRQIHFRFPLRISDNFKHCPVNSAHFHGFFHDSLYILKRIIWLFHSVPPHCKQICFCFCMSAVRQEFVFRFLSQTEHHSVILKVCRYPVEILKKQCRTV